MPLDAGPLWRHFRLAVLLLLGAMVTAAPALAQSGRPPYDAAEIQRKVLKSAALQRQALESLSDPPRAAKLVQSAGTELRAAQHEMIMNASGAKFVDPLFELSNKRAQEALVHLQIAGDALRSSQVSLQDGVRQHIEQAVRLTNGLAF